MRCWAAPSEWRSSAPPRGSTTSRCWPLRLRPSPPRPERSRLHDQRESRTPAATPWAPAGNHGMQRRPLRKRRTRTERRVAHAPATRETPRPRQPRGQPSVAPRAPHPAHPDQGALPPRCAPRVCGHYHTHPPSSGRDSTAGTPVPPSALRERLNTHPYSRRRRTPRATSGRRRTQRRHLSRLPFRSRSEAARGTPGSLDRLRRSARHQVGPARTQDAGAGNR